MFTQKKATTWFVKLSVVLYSLAAAMMPLGACDVCFKLPGIPFETDHPAAIEVAMATHDALEKGELESNPNLGRLFPVARQVPSRLDRLTAQKLVQLWKGSRPARSSPASRFTLDFVFIDVECVCQVDVRFGDVLTDAPRSGPADVQVFVTRAGFCRMIADGLEVCEQRAFAVVDSEDVELRAGLAGLFTSRISAEPLGVVTSL